MPAVICVVLALLSRRDVGGHQAAHAARTRCRSRSRREQFAWNIRYAGPDGKFGTPDDVVSLNQLHFPVGKPVVVTLRSKDVIHSFFLPEFRVKQDAVPGTDDADLVRGARARATGRSPAPSSAGSGTTG